MKNINVHFDPNKLLTTIVNKELKKLHIDTRAIVLGGNIHFSDQISSEQFIAISNALEKYDVKISNYTDNTLIEQIKQCVIEEIHHGDLRKKNISSVLSEKLGYSYSHISSLFSHKTFTTIENFCIFIKIEKVKELLISDSLSIAEIAHKLDYSSSSHLSTQFKNVTGLTISKYLELLAKRGQK